MALVDPRTSRQQVEPLAEAAFDPVEPEGGQPRRRQLDGERAAVEAAADLADPRPVGRGEGGAPGLPGPLEEQRHGVALAALAGQREAGHREHPLERQHEPGLGRGQHGHAGAAAEHPLHEHPDPAGQVLAVVEHEQGLAVGEVGEDVLLARPTRRVGEPEGAAHGRGDQGLVGDRHQVDEPHAVAPAIGHGSGHGGGEAGLAHAAGPECGHQPLGRHRGDEVGHLGGPADERRERDGHRAPCGDGLAPGAAGGGAGGAVAGAVVVAVGVAGPAVDGRAAIGGLGGVREAGERSPVGHVELAEQRRHVALDRAHGDEEAGRDLGVGGPVGHELEHLGLALGHAGVDEGMSFRHGSSLPVGAPLRT